MSRQYYRWAIILVGICSVIWGGATVFHSACMADEPAKKESSSESEKPKEPEIPQLSKVVPDATPISGLLNFYRKKDRLLAEMTSSHLNTDYIIIISIAKGIGEAPLMGGWSWDFGDDMIWQFRKVDDRIQIVRRNFRYQATAGTPEAKALEIAYTDSIIYSLPIMARGPHGGDVIDMTGIFMSDLPQISSKSGFGVSFVRDRSTWAKVKGLKDNMEIQVAATYSGGRELETVMDSRGISLNIHYSISKLPTGGYQPRLADERVGYFNTVVKNFSKNPDDGNFVRYINRWNLQKLESSSETSLPKKPIVFWLEKSIPYQYRKPIRDGILEWNKAFEEAGFYNAIEVRQQEDTDTWDPEDVNYNTIRWSTANVGFAIGPCRVNPLSGEILDADVILDVGFIKSWNQAFELHSPDVLARQYLISPFFTEIFENTSGNHSTGKTALNEKETPCPFDENVFYSQQMGLTSAFFDILEWNNDNDVLDTDDWAEEENLEIDSENNPDQITLAKGNPKKTAKKADSKDKKDADKKTKVVADKTDSNKKESDKKPANVKKDGKTEVAKNNDVKEDDAKDKEKSAEEKKAELAKKEQEAKAERTKQYTANRNKVITQGLSQLTTHEVGHTLGLRHNFKLSTLHSLDEINKWSASSKYGYLGSIMDYQPVNIMPKGMKQGEYYSTRLGPYDYWVINYGYRSFGKGTDSEKDDLQKIASQQTKPEHNYATDEDSWGVSDPLVSTFDLGSSPLEYAKLRVKLVYQILPGLNKRIVKDGESYAKLMSRFDMLLMEHMSAMTLVQKYIGGMHVNRDFKGDKDERPPFQVIPAKEQREALALLNKEMFSPEAYRVPASIYNYLAPNRWRHWGSTIPSRYNMDIHQKFNAIQRTFLASLLSKTRLSNLADAAYRLPLKEDCFTMEEMLDSLTQSIFAEYDSLTDKPYSIRKPAVSSLRRNLQRTYVDILINRLMAVNSSSLSISGSYMVMSPPAGVTMNDMARVELEKINEKLSSTLDEKENLDPYTRAGMKELMKRIEAALNAQAELSL